MVNPAHAILIVAGSDTLNLVVSLLRLRWLRLSSGADKVDVAVQARLNTGLELHLRNVLDLGYALGSVEVSRGKRQQDVVDWQELGAWTTLLLVVPHLQVLGAA